MDPEGREVAGRRGAMARLSGWLLVLFAAVATAAAAGAGADGVLRVGGDAAYPPYHFLDGRGDANGFDVELSREIARDLGLEVRFELGEWNTALERLARGEIDIVPMFWSAERGGRFLFTQPILIRHHALFGSPSQQRLESLEALSGVRVAVQHASLAWEALRAQAGPGVTLVESSTESAAVVAVADGRADYALVPTGIGYHAIHQRDMRDMIALSPPLLERLYAFAARPDRADLVARIDASLERLRAEGVQHDLYVAWIGNLSARDRRPWPAAGTALAAMLLIGAGAYAWRRNRQAVPPPGAPGPGEPALLADLREAIEGGGLGYVLQPKLDLRSGRWLGAELLVRWDHPRHGPIAPDDFVPLAEQARIIGMMSLYLMCRGQEERLRWPPFDPPLHLSVNVSANDLADRHLVDAILQLHGQSGPGLMLEVTETDVMREPERVAEAVPRLRERGIRISIDDFGAGHSSLVNLRRLAPDELKIDRAFIASLTGSRSDQAIVTAIIALAHDLGATVTAEGIEDEQTMHWLARAGCDAGQGFGIARPMAADAFAALLVRDGARPARPFLHP